MSGGDDMILIGGFGSTKNEKRGTITSAGGAGLRCAQSISSTGMRKMGVAMSRCGEGRTDAMSSFPLEIS